MPRTTSPDDTRALALTVLTTLAALDLLAMSEPRAERDAVARASLGRERTASPVPMPLEAIGT